ncbi:MAG: CHAT domain-containing protein, partial [Cyanobacteriota bacterium]
IRRLLHPDIPCSLRGKQATLANVIDALRTCEGVFHFAGHAQHDINQPLESALFLAGGEELSLHKILQLDLSRFRLVCLSACETGITGQEDLINEFVGLVSGFLSAGATSVISSLWLAGDLSTAFLMIKFHENLKTSDSVAIALNQAQKWLRSLTIEELDIVLDKLKPQIEQAFAQLPKSKYKIFEVSLEQARKRKPYPFANPYYWAAFIATGF